MYSPQSLLRAPPSGPSAAADALLRDEVARVRSSGVLGEARLRDLFDYLATNTLAGRSPKEMTIAIDVFGKDPKFDVSRDALVRVYIHKLRKGLEGLYASASETDPVLYIPRGEYRLRVKMESPAAILRPTWASGRRLSVMAIAIAAALLLALGFGLGLSWRRAFPTELDRVRANPVWAGILADDRPIMIVMGDYYLIGETDGGLDVQRLVREYSVNSKSDLERYVASRPELAASYMDVGLHYLPISAALALRNVMLVLAPQNRRITISKMSDLEPDSLKSADIVYIGYLSGMGMFQDMAFTGSRFAIGQSYDEIVDKKTQHSYVSQVGSQIVTAPAAGAKRTYRDYGIFEKLQGPSGNTILVISGTRDEGVSQTAEAFTNTLKLGEFAQQTSTKQPFEALLEVRAFDGTNLAGTVLLQSARDKTNK